MTKQYHNLMEDIVLQYVDMILEAGGGCCCETCRVDTIAYALNHLPAHYVVSDMGKVMVKLKSYEPQFKTDVIAALTEAARVVREKPRHG